MQYSIRDTLDEQLGLDAANDILVKAGRLAGHQFCKNLLNVGLPTNEFIADLHLTWQAKQVASGDYSQRVHFMGELSEAFNTMVESLDKDVRLLKAKINELETTLSLVRTLERIPLSAPAAREFESKEAIPWTRRPGYSSKAISVRGLRLSSRTRFAPCAWKGCIPNTRRDRVNLLPEYPGQRPGSQSDV